MTGAVNAADLLRTQSDRVGELPCLRCGEGEWLSYAELDDLSSRTAAGLVSLGVEPGNRVVILAANSTEMAECVFAISKVGAVQVPLNTYLRGSFLNHQLADSGAKVAIVDVHGLASLRRLGPECPIERIVLIGPSDPDPMVTALSELRQASDPLPPRSARRGDLAAIMYTSGTTGPAKGCMVPNGMFTETASVFGSAGWFVPGDRVLTTSPLFHMGCQSGMLMAALANDAALCVLDHFSASGFMPFARAIDATVIYGVGAAAVAILGQPASPSDPDNQLRCALWVPLPGDRADEFERRFDVPTRSAAYGQTECISISLSSISEALPHGCAGRPNDLVEVSVFDDQDRELGPGQSGEIVVRPSRPNFMYQGYWNRPEASVKAVRGLWHHTGDLGRLDEDGRLWITDRKVDALRRRGENVSSTELEAVIRRYPGVREVAVHGVPSEMSEQDIKACICLNGDQTPPSTQDLFDFFRRELPYFAIPRYVEFLEELPVNAIGRVRKDVLRERPHSVATWDFEQLGYSVVRDERR